MVQPRCAFDTVSHSREWVELVILLVILVTLLSGKLSALPYAIIGQAPQLVTPLP